jgi:hypothetical protein
MNVAPICRPKLNTRQSLGGFKQASCDAAKAALGYRDPDNNIAGSL